MRRARSPEAPRVPFYLYIDEFQSFATDALAAILAEARKYGLVLVIAHQYLDQLGEEIRRSVFGNVGNLLAFRVGQGDARILGEELGGDVGTAILVSLGNHEFFARFLDGGRAREPFRGKTLPPIRATASGRREAVVGRSRERYGRARAEVERRVERWFGSTDSRLPGTARGR